MWRKHDKNMDGKISFDEFVDVYNTVLDRWTINLITYSTLITNVNFYQNYNYFWFLIIMAKKGQNEMNEDGITQVPMSAGEQPDKAV